MLRNPNKSCRFLQGRRKPRPSGEERGRMGQWIAAGGIPEPGAATRSLSPGLCNAETRRKSAGPSSAAGRYSYSLKQTATPILGGPDFASAGPLSAALTVLSTRPRQRTCIVSPRVTSEGIFKVSSISVSSRNAISVKKKTPRELRSWVNPNPSVEVSTWRTETGRSKAKRCPMRRSTATEGVFMVARLPSENRRREQVTL